MTFSFNNLGLISMNLAIISVGYDAILLNLLTSVYAATQSVR